VPGIGDELHFLPVQCRIFGSSTPYPQRLGPLIEHWNGKQ